MEEELRKVKRFTDLDVWRRSHQLFLDVLKDAEQFPRNKAADANQKS